MSNYDWRKVTRLILMWSLVFGIIATLLRDLGAWDRLPLNLLWRILIVIMGGGIGLALDYFTGSYVGMSTSAIQSMGIIKFSSDTPQKITNTFIFVGALLGALAAWAFIR